MLKHSRLGDCAGQTPPVSVVAGKKRRVMESNTAIALPLEQIANLCEAYGVQQLDVFGSVLRVEQSENYIRRRHILSSARTLYVA
jgi:hypothetical protein